MYFVAHPHMEKNVSISKIYMLYNGKLNGHRICSGQYGPKEG